MKKNGAETAVLEDPSQIYRKYLPSILLPVGSAAEAIHIAEPLIPSKHTHLGSDSHMRSYVHVKEAPTEQ